ncbi:hypothetical protein HDU91_004396, partial [Kappamyces sp. JEL0680]
KTYDEEHLTFLDELIIKDMDLNQVWEQLQLFNEPAMARLQDWCEEMGQRAEISAETGDEDGSENEYEAMLEQDVGSEQSQSEPDAGDASLNSDEMDLQEYQEELGLEGLE